VPDGIYDDADADAEGCRVEVGIGCGEGWVLLDVEQCFQEM
jgi:hypothetical protein